MDSPSEDGGWVTLARLVKTQGRKGELAAEVLSDIPDRFAGLGRVWLRHPDGRRAEMHLARHWPHQGRIVLAFDGIGDMDAAAAWVGAEVQVPSAQRPPAPAGAYYHSDLEGCRVFDGGREIGTLRVIEDMAGAAPLLHVEPAAGGNEILIPFAESYIVEIAPAERRLALRLPEGLLDLNR